MGPFQQRYVNSHRILDMVLELRRIYRFSSPQKMRPIRPKFLGSFGHHCSHSKREENRWSRKRPFSTRDMLHEKQHLFYEILFKISLFAGFWSQETDFRSHFPMNPLAGSHAMEVFEGDGFARHEVNDHRGFSKARHSVRVYVPLLEYTQQ